jgi:hypothetical protein
VTFIKIRSRRRKISNSNVFCELSDTDGWSFRMYDCFFEIIYSNLNSYSMQLCFCIISVHEEYLNSALALPSRTQSLKAAIVFNRDVTVKASSKNALNLQNVIKTVKFLVSTLSFSRTMCLGFTITASWSKMPLIT